MIRVLITEDSPVVRGYLEYVLNADPDIEVVGLARNGEEAVRMVQEVNPDVVTMDIHMPRMDGFEATRKIMETHPVPIVICSASWNPEEVDKTFRSMEAGAVAALEKPGGMGHPDSKEMVGHLIRTVKAMSGVKVVRRWAKKQRRTVKIPETPPPKPVQRHKVRPKSQSGVELLVIGASTGGPMALQTILSGIDKDIPVPVMIVQHIAPGFLSGLGTWLTSSTGFTVTIPEHNDLLIPGNAYLAPDGYQFGVKPGWRVELSDAPPEANLKPAVSYLFRSAAEIYRDKVVGVLLTGMGRDGAAELKMISDAGGVTIAQDKESSVVHGMPGEAIKLGAAKYIEPLDSIARRVMNLVK
ncbi:chemotaxis-specific protein-glutamate methyltransferase CheB [bacterium]|nr:chemotaxis-specific protein-glutamate methyltransferase CheB [bacterium]